MTGNPAKRLAKYAFGAAMAALLGLTAPQAQAQAPAQDKRVRIQLATAFPSSITILGAAQQRLLKSMKDLSQGSLDVRLFEPGALVPGSQYFDAISAGTLDMAFTGLGFFSGKESSLPMFNTVPFGPDPGEYLAWFEHGGGTKLMEEIAGRFGVVPMLCGMISPEASGWFRKEIKSVEDLRGLKMRFFGLGANVMQKMGVNTQLLQPGEIFQALQLGTIDATEFAMPAMDISLGFYQVAKFYYFPGWHQLTTVIHLLVSQKKWAELSDTQKIMIRTACKAQMLDMYTDAEAMQFKPLRELKEKGVEIRKWPPEILKAYENAWAEVVKEESAKNPTFARVWESMSKFRADYAIWKDLGYLK
jgi:TRAP-type mannitol/chloroaromatic compound transport system substrate-binding protein